MKLISLFLLLSISSFGQTKFDIMLFNKMNDYRTSKHLKELVWDSISFKSADQHSKFLVGKDYFSHYEDILFDPKDRYNFYGGKISYVDEIITGCSINFSKKDLYILEKLTQTTFDNWRKSKKHNEILLDPTLNYGGCSTIIKITEQGISEYVNYNTISTFILIEN